MSSVAMQSALIDGFQRAQSDVDVLLCPNASDQDKLGAAAALALQLVALTPGTEKVQPTAESFEQARNAALEALGEIDPVGVGKNRFIGFTTGIGGTFK